jgi:hypothetical protein
MMIINTENNTSSLPSDLHYWAQSCVPCQKGVDRKFSEKFGKFSEFENIHALDNMIKNNLETKNGLMSELNYMTSMRDAWEREAEALRTAMHMWADRAHLAEEAVEILQEELERINAAKHIQAEAHAHMQKKPATLTPIRTLEPAPTPASCDPMEAKGARMALEEEEAVMTKPFRWPTEEEVKRVISEADEQYSANHSIQSPFATHCKCGMIKYPSLRCWC